MNNGKRNERPPGLKEENAVPAAYLACARWLLDCLIVLKSQDKEQTQMATCLSAARVHAQSFIMGPHADDFNGVLLFQNLINQAVLDVYAAGISAA